MKNQVLVHVTSVEVLRDYLLRLSFDDGTIRDVDVKDLLRGPIFEPLTKDPVLFRQVKVDHELGTIVWPNGADIDPMVLHGSAEPAWKNANSGAPHPGSAGEPIYPDPGYPETRGRTRDK